MLPGAHRQVRKRAGGKIAAYWYAWRGGPAIGRFEGRSEAELIENENSQAVALARAYADERTQRPAIGTVARAVREYRESPEYESLSDSWKRETRKYLELIEARFGLLSGAEMADDDRAAAVRKWRDELAPKSPRGADQAMEVLSRLCSWARQRSVKLLPPDCKPTAGLGRVYTRPPQPAWSRDQIDAAMSKLPPRIANVVALALNTGLRRADLCALTWSAIDEAAGVIRWAPQKGRKKRRVVVIRLTLALRATLKRIPRVAPQVLTNAHGAPWKPDSLYQAVMRALSAIDAKGTLHGLRRSSATQLAMQGLSSRQIARQLGWSEHEAETMSALYIDEEENASGTGEETGGKL